MGSFERDEIVGLSRGTSKGGCRHRLLHIRRVHPGLSSLCDTSTQACLTKRNAKKKRKRKKTEPNCMLAKLRVLHIFRDRSSFRGRSPITVRSIDHVLTTSMNFQRKKSQDNRRLLKSFSDNKSLLIRTATCATTFFHQETISQALSSIFSKSNSPRILR